MTQERKERMISEYVAALTGVSVKTEVIEDTPVLSVDGLWHIYLLYDRMRFIGVCDDGDIQFLAAVRDRRKDILDLYRRLSDGRE